MNSSIYDNDWKVSKARELPTNENLETDIVIIGSGAGGGFSAEILAKSQLYSTDDLLNVYERSRITQSVIKKFNQLNREKK